MHKVEITIQKKTIKRELPQNWNELSVQQLLYVAHLMGKSHPLTMFNTFLLFFLLRIDRKAFFSFSGLIVADLTKAIDFIHETKELTLNKLPEIKVKRLFKEYTFYGPADGCLSLTFEQFFGHCEPALNDYIKTKNISSLDYLIASLYTTEKENFDADKIQDIQKYVKRLKLNYKIAILLFYLGCKDYFAFRFPLLFKKQTSKTNVGKVSDLYLIELTDQLNNESLGNNEQVKKSNILEAFMRLSRMIELSEKLEEQRKQQKRKK